MLDLNKINRMYKEATPGEWISQHSNLWKVIGNGMFSLIAVNANSDPVFANTTDVKFIAAMHNAWPEIKAEVERLTNENAKLLSSVARLNEQLEAMSTDLNNAEVHADCQEAKVLVFEMDCAKLREQLEAARIMFDELLNERFEDADVGYNLVQLHEEWQERIYKWLGVQTNEDKKGNKL